ncbi:MAG: polysulfide reductase NrfD [Calditrichia bacterium]
MNSEILYVTQQGPAWDWRVALDLFLGGAGVGAILFSIFVDEYFKGKYRRICHTAAWLGPILVGLGLFFLVLKMGRPFHLFNSYLNFNPLSPLWWGGIFQPILLVLGFVYALKWHEAQEQDDTRRKLGRILAPVAIIVGAYHGLLLAVNVSRPLWNTGPTVLAAILGFLTTGIAAVMVVHLFRMKKAGRLDNEEHVKNFLNDMIVVRNILVGGILLQLTTFFLWWLSLKYGSLLDKEALALANEHYGPMFWFMGIGIGLVIPLLMGAYAVLKDKTADTKFQIMIVTTTSILILVGGFFFRLAVVLAGQVEIPFKVFF